MGLQHHLCIYWPCFALGYNKKEHEYFVCATFMRNIGIKLVLLHHAWWNKIKNGMHIQKNSYLDVSLSTNEHLTVKEHNSARVDVIDPCLTLVFCPSCSRVWQVF